MLYEKKENWIKSIEVPPFSDHERSMMDELWIKSSSSSTSSSETSDDHALIDFSECSANFQDFRRQSYRYEQLRDPFDTVLLGASNHPWEPSSCFGAELVSIQPENDDYPVKFESKPIANAYSQEDVLQEIVAHIDTLITTRDKMSRRETNAVTKTDVAELISFFDHYEGTSVEDGRVEASAGYDTRSEGVSETTSTSDCGRLPANAFSEEEISYNDNHSNEDTSYHRAVADSEIESKLSSIFPADIVQQVLTVNASRNVAFLADQCAELCSWPADYWWLLINKQTVILLFYTLPPIQERTLETMIHLQWAATIKSV